MSEKYLWDKSEPVDPEIERLERLLEPLRCSTPVPLLARPRPRGGLRRLAVPVLAAAAALLLVVALAWRAERPHPKSSVPPEGAAGWAVTALAGTPTVSGTPSTRLNVGQTLVTDPSSRARIAADDVGEVVVQPGTRLRLVEAGARLHRLVLEHGALQAFIVAPPGRFVVDTRSARAVDLGCVYTLAVAEEGNGLISVQAGWVAFQFKGRESFVPSGASCRTSPAHGPGLPRFDDADERFRSAADALDGAASAKDRASILGVLLEKARRRDALTLWHLLARVGPEERARVVAALAGRMPPPDAATRDGALRLEQTALDRWWNTLGLGDVGVWRSWERPMPALGEAHERP